VGSKGGFRPASIRAKTRNTSKRVRRRIPCHCVTQWRRHDVRKRRATHRFKRHQPKAQLERYRAVNNLDWRMRDAWKFRSPRPVSCSLVPVAVIHFYSRYTSTSPTEGRSGGLPAKALFVVVVMLCDLFRCRRPGRRRQATPPSAYGSGIQIATARTVRGRER
jgi:hypothetical protein